MIAGSRSVPRPIAEVTDRLRLILASRACHCSEAEDGRVIHFRYGSSGTQAAPVLPLRGTFRLAEGDGATAVSYQVHVATFMRVWLLLLATAFCWLVFPPILVYRALRVTPRSYAESILAGL
jgi:hypothetical protein